MRHLKTAIIALMLTASIAALPAFGELAAAGAHALYLDESGIVWAWGSNQMGESANESDDAFIAIPKKLKENAIQIACGRQASYVLDEQGVVWLWGDLDGEAVATQKLAENAVKIAANEYNYAILTDEGDIIYRLDSERTVINANAADVAVGADFILYISQNKAWFMGSGEYLGEEAWISEAVPVFDNTANVYAAGQSAMIVDDSGLVYVFGASGSEGRLGINLNEWITTPTLLSDSLGAAQMLMPSTSFGGGIFGNDMYIWGTLYNLFNLFDESGETYMLYNEGVLINYGKTPILLYQNVKCCAAGDAFVIIEFNDGSLLSWGSNEWGQAGDGWFTEFVVTEGEDEDDFDIYISDNQQRVFPSVPIIPK